VPIKKGHRNSSSTDLRPRPTAALLKIIAKYPSVNAAARAFGMCYGSLQKWLNDEQTLSGRNIAQIKAATGKHYESLFKDEKE
jgi:molybdenum-dependent DNA-binding transcriptional regulator ModE